jgi:hypothetical protein
MTLKFPIQPPDAISLAPVGPTAVSVFRRSCSFFSELGFLTISDCKGSPIVSMFEDHSCSIVDDVSTHLIYLLLCARLRRALLLYARSINLPGLDDSAAIAKLRSWLTKYTSTEPQADDKVRYPIESSDVSISSDDVFRCFTIRAEINIGGHRRAHVHFEMTMRSGSALSGKAEASLDMSFRVGAEGLRTRRGGAVTP